MRKVLVVDDTKNIRTLLTTCLEVEGYKVLTAIDGKQALEMIQHDSYDLIFLDVKLPEFSGTEVLRKIRETEIHTPVIIMTAFGTVKNAVDCTKLGAIAYLQKPFTAEKVRNVLADIEKQLENNPSSIELYLSNSKELIRENKFDQAFKLLKQALAIAPNCGEVYYLIARVYEGQENTLEATRFDLIAKQFEN